MRRAFHLVVASLIGVFASSSVWAQTTRTWTGFAGPIVPNTNTYAFETAGNWSGNVAPVNGDNLVFGPLPSVSINLTNAFTAGNITFSGIQNGLYLVGPSSLTLNGNVATTTGSIYWGLFDLPVVLAAGNHIYTPGGSADIYHFGAISGAGGITTNGPNNLFLSATSTYTGGTVVNGGTLYAGANAALGTGTVTLNNSTTLATAYSVDPVILQNNFQLGANVTFGSGANDNVSLSLGSIANGTTVAPVTGVTTVNLSLVGKEYLYFYGALINGAGATTYTFSGSDAAYVLEGSNTYTGGTLVKSGATVLFANSLSIPTTGQITVQSNAYAGLGDNSLTAATFLSQFNTTSSAGTIGFDQDKTYTGPINLSGFSDTALSIGTVSGATLTGAITPVTGSGAYNFSGSGWLRLVDPSSPNPLTGANAVVARTMTNRAPLVVVLRPTGTNNYSGNTEADGAGIVFDTSGALSAASSIQLSNGGYVSVTDTSGLTLGNLVSKVGGVTNGGVLGLDSSSFVNNGTGSYTDSNPVNFSTLTQDVYLGTTTVGGVTVTGTIQTANSNTGDYFLTGYNGGLLDVTSQLTGSRALHVGLVQDLNSYSGVMLSNATNNFTGDVFLNANNLFAPNIASLGAGTLLTVDTGVSDRSASLITTGTLTKAITLQSGLLELVENNSAGPIILDGVITGAGGLSSQALDGNRVTLTKNNSYTGGNFFGSRSVITAASNAALGSGSLSLTEGAQVNFTNTTAQIGSLLVGDPYTLDGTVHAALVLAATGTTVLTINQTDDGTFSGAITQNGSAGSLVKTGPAALTIYGDLNSGATPYSGGTTITGGTLIAGGAGALGTGAITLAGGNLEVAMGLSLPNVINFSGGGGTLKGNATFSSPVTVGTGGKLSPGDSPGTMTFTAGLTLAAGGLLNFEVQSANGAAGTGYDLINVSGGLLDVTATSGSPFTIKLVSLDASGAAGNVADFSAGNGYSWMLFQGNAVSGITNFSANSFTLDTSAFSNSIGTGTFSFSPGVNAGNPAIYLNFTPVPEPSTYALLVLGLAGLALKARRRRA